MHVAAFHRFVPSPSWLHRAVHCHSLQWLSVSLMNGSLSQFPDEKGEGQRDQAACLQSWVGLQEPGWALGSAGVGTHSTCPCPAAPGPVLCHVLPTEHKGQLHPPPPLPCHK